MTQTSVNWQTAPGHQVLAAAGKTVLRPGGYKATEQLFSWANLQPGDTVLELASSFGESAITLARRYGVQVTGVEKNPDSVERARANVTAAGLSDLITIVEGDIFQLQDMAGQFDAVLAEAILSMQSAAGKAKILTGVCARLKPGGTFLSHELLATGHETELLPALRQAIRVNTTPLSEQDWINAVTTARLLVHHHQTGAMELLKPMTILREEGMAVILKMTWTLWAHPPIRQRILGMRDVFQTYRHDLGYIILCAHKPEGATA